MQDTLPKDRTGLILWFKPKVERSVESFVWANPHFRGVKDDLISVGFIKMIESIDRFLTRKSQNSAHLSNYIRISVVTGISDFIRDNSTIRAPKDRWIPCGGLSCEPVDERTEKPTTTVDDLLDACDDGADRVLLNMALQGATRKQISAYLCETQARVRARAKGIMDRSTNE